MAESNNSNKNDIREKIEIVDAQFNALFTSFQKNKRLNPNYLKSDGFKDLKILFELYSETFHLKGYNYNSLSIEKVSIIIKGFDCYQQRELVQYLIKTLVKKGNEDEAKRWFQELAKLEMKCCLTSIGKLDRVSYNFFKLLYKATSFNLYTLLLSILIYLTISYLIFLPAYFDCCQLIEIKKTTISHSEFWNSMGNILMFLFDFDNKMDVKPSNFFGVILLVLLRVFFILIIVNVLIKELLNKIKLS